MKTLYIVRHAKSSWDDLSASDHDRELLPVGIQRTRKVAAWLKSRNVFPDKIISSTATRAYETARLLAEGIGFPVEKIETTRALYGAGPEEAEALLFELPDAVNSVMMVGHNPGFTEWVNEFLEYSRQIHNLPTSAVAAVRFDTNRWEELSLANSTVEFIITPKMLKKKKF
ncbi:histidine phosphatase family protein [Candidatus Sulfidibacterium hydrothermale]|uniref:SixA phosphatase family protein n=1 Tax=Candidatus Sulfidibacterium hydrothermale TaxID=2875962 RepID=UPI001F0A251D|nr:histidine phosphatase family protein [Candidatus Sulfidibacterium hydrothermale]UBM62578.1 histidine phosphatase family protein [Candidatus Sulfidibacterium hydrothermale]